jgi:hypothetical protein
MHIKLFYIIMCLITSISSFGQKAAYDISIYVSSISRYSFGLKIERYIESVTITNYAMDIRERSSRNDSINKNNNLLKRFEADSAQNYLKFWISKHNVGINTDTLSFGINDYPDYVWMIDSLFNYKGDIMDDKSQKKSSIVVADGSTFEINLRQEGNLLYSNWTDPPSKKYSSFPDRLISASLDLFRKRKPNSFLDKTKTLGY